MAIFLPRRWNRQPPYNAGVDWNNPLTRGMTFASIGNSRVNVVYQAQDTRNFAFSTAATPAGLALDPTTTADRYVVAPPTNTTDFCLLTVVQPTSVTGLQQIAARQDSIALGLTRQFQFRTNGADLEFIRFNTAGSAFTAVAAAAAEIGKVMVAVASSSGANMLVQTATQRGTATITGTPTTWSAATLTHSRWFERFQLFTGVPGEHGSHLSALRVIFNRGLSDSEARELSVNPWQLFRPAANQTFYSLPSQGVSTLVLSNPTVFNITTNSANPRVTITI